jgi:hypothetical protein
MRSLNECDAGRAADRGRGLMRAMWLKVHRVAEKGYSRKPHSYAPPPMAYSELGVPSAERLGRSPQMKIEHLAHALLLLAE